MPEPVRIEDLYDIEWLEDPRVSPDGAWIAYVRVTPDRAKNSYRRAIWLATPEGACKQFTAGTHQDHTPRWSPDGARIAFLSPVHAAERHREDTNEAEEPPADPWEARRRQEQIEHEEQERVDPRVITRLPKLVRRKELALPRMRR